MSLHQLRCEAAEGDFSHPHLIGQVVHSVQSRVDHQHGIGQRLVLQLTHGKHPVIQSGAGSCPECFLQGAHTNTLTWINTGLTERFTTKTPGSKKQSNRLNIEWLHFSVLCSFNK